MGKKKTSKKLDSKEIAKFAMASTGGIVGVASSIIVSKLINNKKKK